MKMIIKVGQSEIEVEGEHLQVTKVTSVAGTAVEIKGLKSKEEALQELLDKATAGFQAAMREAGHL